ncbi:MAG: glycosyltransferase, partial [Chloroflexota bacterium]
MIDGRPVISTVEGGQVAVDQVILNLWQFADGKTLPEILGDYPDSEVTQDEIRAGLACLTEARLLIRDREEVVDEAEEKTGSLISIIIVAHNSRDWLEDCLESIFQQTYKNLEVVLIDNGSQDDTEKWITSAFPQVKYSFLEKLLPF